MAKRAPGDLQRLGPAELAAQQSQHRPVESPALDEPGTRGDVDRQHAPGRAVQLHRHPTAPVVTQRGDRRHYFVFAAALPIVSGSAWTLPF